MEITRRKSNFTINLNDVYFPEQNKKEIGNMDCVEQWNVETDELDDNEREIIEDFQSLIDELNTNETYEYQEIEEITLDWYYLLHTFNDINQSGLQITLEMIIKCLSDVKVLVINTESFYFTYKNTYREYYNWIDFLKYFPELRKLEVQNEKIANIPLEVIEYQKFEELDFTNNEITNIPAGINKLDKLNTLIIDNNQIQNIDISIEELEKLNLLSLKNNRINSRTGLSFPLSIEYLDLSYNLLFNIDYNLILLPNLKTLNLANNFITTFDLSIDQVRYLQKLEKLNLSNNFLFEFQIYSCYLKSLKELNLSNNLLKKLPDEISNLENLETINLKNNTNFNDRLKSNLFVPKDQFKILNEKIDAKFLKYPDLGYYSSYNGITELPETISKLDKLEKIFIQGNNKLEKPPIEIVNQGIKAIEIWFNSENKILFPEGKLVLIGNSGVGKTTILNNLLNSDYKLTQHNSTETVDIKKWLLPIQYGNDEQEHINIMYRFNVWDFGGQGKYRAIQQFFLTRNSLYLYVTTPINNTNTKDIYVNFKYWLSVINSFSNKNNISPIIYVMNKTDIDANFMNAYNSDFSKIEKSYTLKDSIAISCKTGHQIEKLEEKIINNIQDDSLNNEYSKKWIKVKEYIDNLTDDYIDYQTFIQIARNNNLKDKEADIWLNVLNQTGNILRFENIQELENKIIIKPNWVRQIVYKAIGSNVIERKNGKFIKEDFPEIWNKYSSGNNIEKKYTEQEQKLSVKLLKEFEFCYEVNNNDKVEYFIPTLFPDNKIEFDTNNSIRYECEFTPFIPAGILHKITVRQNKYISEYKHFQKEVLFENQNTYAKIEEKWENNKLIIYLSGNKPLDFIKRFQVEIGRIVNDLNESKYIQIKYDEYIFCNCKNVSSNCKFNLNHILQKFHSGRYLQECKLNPLKEIDIRNSLLGDTRKYPKDNIGNLKGKLFEMIVERIFLEFFNKDSVESNKQLGKYEYDLIIHDFKTETFIIVEAKGYKASKTIELGDYKTKNTIKWFFNKTYPEAVKKLQEKYPKSKFHPCFVTSANLSSKAIEFLEKFHKKETLKTLKRYYFKDTFLNLINQCGLTKIKKEIKQTYS